MDRVCQLTLPGPDAMLPLVEQHRAIMAAIDAHDADGAAAAMHRHLTEILRALPRVEARASGALRVTAGCGRPKSMTARRTLNRTEQQGRSNRPNRKREEMRCEFSRGARPWRVRRRLRRRHFFAGPAGAQTKLKWAHVYETCEPYHTWAVWAADEFKQAHRRPLQDRGVPRLLARQGERHQRGPVARHRRHHLYRPALRRPLLRADRHRRRALHVPRLRPLGQISASPTSSRSWPTAISKKSGNQSSP